MRKFKNARTAFRTICQEEGYEPELFRLNNQPECVRRWCLSNGSVCFEIDTARREINYYRSVKFWATPHEIVTF